MSNPQLIKNDHIKRDLLQRQTYHGSSAWKDLGMVPSNCLTVRKDLGDLLQSNEVGIDVEVRLHFIFFSRKIPVLNNTFFLIRTNIASSSFEGGTHFPNTSGKI